MSVHAGTDAGTFARRARSFAAIHAGRATETLVSNLHARVETITTGAGDLPVSVHDSRSGDAWVCSPRSTYADYAAEECARHAPGWATPLALHAIPSIGRVLAWAGIDHAVTINNWLVSTNLYPPLALVDTTAVIAEAVERWPRHALWFRSLNEHDSVDWLTALRAGGCKLVASRQVYLYDDLASLATRHKNLERDLAFLGKTQLRHCPDADIVEADYLRIAELYASLYVGKYSRFNPQYGPELFRLWHRAGLLEFEGFRDARGQLVCVVGLTHQGRTCTTPVVGYDTAQPREAGLYRLAIACAFRACIARGWRLNLSAGAAGFKRLRGGVPSVEYSAVYARHLPRRTRAAFGVLSGATCRLGVPLLRKFRL
jgi:hypothetical protein